MKRRSHTLALALDERVEKKIFELSLHVSQTGIRLHALNKHCQPHYFLNMCICLYPSRRLVVVDLRYLQCFVVSFNSNLSASVIWALCLSFMYLRLRAVRSVHLKCVI